MSEKKEKKKGNNYTRNSGTHSTSHGTQLGRAGLICPLCTGTRWHPKFLLPLLGATSPDSRHKHSLVIPRPPLNPWGIYAALKSWDLEVFRQIPVKLQQTTISLFIPHVQQMPQSFLFEELHFLPWNRPRNTSGQHFNQSQTALLPRIWKEGSAPFSSKRGTCPTVTWVWVFFSLFFPPSQIETIEFSEAPSTKQWLGQSTRGRRSVASSSLRAQVWEGLTPAPTAKSLPAQSSFFFYPGQVLSWYWMTDHKIVQYKEPF